MDDPILLRGLFFLGPGAATVMAFALARPEPRRATGALVATGFAFVALLAFNLLAVWAGAWRFEVEGGDLAGIPWDLMLGWALLWGALPAILAPRVPILAVLGVLLALDLLVMPRAAPVVVVGPAWVACDIAGLALIAAPAQLLARATADRARLDLRVALQALTFAGLNLLLIPLAVFEYEGRDLFATLASMNPLDIIGLQAALLPGAIGLWAVDELRARGGGTPLPYDPPPRLVTSGPYAYVRSPMQLSMVLMFIGLAASLGSPWLLSGVVVMVAYSAGLAAWHERADLEGRFGAAYVAYRQGVGAWWPRAAPYVSTDATLYVGDGCAPCEGVGAYLTRLGPRGVTLAAASGAEETLTRLTYVEGSLEVRGVEALARTMERVHLGYALLALPLRLPLIRIAVQLVVDAAGGGPRTISRRGARADP